MSVLHRQPGAPINPGAIHRAVLAGFITQIGRKGEERDYHAPRGVTFFLSPGSVLFRQDPPWVVVAELVETTKLYGRTAARIRSDWVERVAPHLVQRDVFEPHWMAESGQVAAWERVSLHGLVLVPKRRVPFGPVDQRAARDIFIQNALVDEQIRTDGEFLAHNRELIEELERVEAKKRARDVLVDFKARFDFYDQRVPADLHSTPSFEKWRRQVERGRPRLLFMSREDLLRPGAGTPAPEHYPDLLESDGLRLPLDYSHEPGEPDDGVTVTVPLAALGQLSPARLDWLVPGLLRDKIVGLLRTLPKRVRVRFVPATEYAEGAAEALRFGEGVLTRQVSDYLRRLTGTPILAEEFSVDELPLHLRMNVRVIDDAGEVVATGRDLAALQRTLAERATSSLGESRADDRERARPREADRPGAPASRPAELLPTRLLDFPVEGIPESLEVERSGMLVPAYPGLVDLGDAASLRLFPTIDSARRASAKGVRRLASIAVADDIRPMLDFLPGPDGVPGIDLLALLHAPLGPREALERALIDLIAERALLREPLPRLDAASFATALEAGRARLWEAGVEVSELARRTLSARHELERALDGPMPSTWDDAVADLGSQMHELIPPGFLASVEWNALMHLPRYLAAANLRLAKLRDSGHLRDAKLMTEVRPRWKRFLERRDALRATSRETPELERHRWMLEEFRVSLFAQELRTATPISAQRIDRHWESVET